MYKGAFTSDNGGIYGRQNSEESVRTAKCNSNSNLPARSLSHPLPPIQWTQGQTKETAGVRSMKIKISNKNKN